MLLAVDIGNSNIVFGIHSKSEWLNHWRIQTDRNKTSDEYGVIFRSLLGHENFELHVIDKIIISTVVPTLLSPIYDMLEDFFQVKPMVFNSEIYGKLPVKALNPNQIGTDLVANSVAAFTKYGGNTMVIDFGTALTFTTIGEDSEIKGVAIAPGLKTAIHSLASNTAQLPFVQLAAPASVLGDNTEHAIQSGVVLGYWGLIDSIIDRTCNELNASLNIVATGGLSKTFKNLSSKIQHFEPLLTLDGLLISSEFMY